LNKDQITDDILSAFDEMAQEGAEEGGIDNEPRPDDIEPEPRDEPQIEPGDEPDEDEPEAEEEVEVAAESDEQPEAPAPSEDEEEEDEPEGQDGDLPPEVQAYLDRHGGDLGKALKTMVEAQAMLARRNTEYGEQGRRIAQLEAELAQAQTFAAQTQALSPEQTEWVQAAVESDQPIAFVQQAVQAGEYELARAVCDAWGSEGDAYAALRTRAQVDQAEAYAYQAQAASEPPAVMPREELISLITQQVPDFPEYEGEMVEVINQLGTEHPMVVAANSPDPATAAAGLVDLYRVAQTRKARVAEVKTEVESERREKKASEKKRGRVSSAASRSSAEPPRASRQIMPGLSLEDLDTALAEQ
jgi:hypothetical protein